MALRRAPHRYRRRAAWWWRRRLPVTWSATLGMDAAFDALLAELEGMQAQGQTIDLGLVRGLVKATLDQLLEQDQIARACAGRRAEADVCAAVASHEDAARSVQQALRYNDLSSVVPLVEGALQRHSMAARPGEPLHSILGREVPDAPRGVAPGRKNWLFAGSQGDGKAGATAYTLIETARLSGVDPQAWLTDVLGCIADHKVTRLDELLPWSYAQRGCA